MLLALMALTNLVARKIPGQIAAFTLAGRGLFNLDQAIAEWRRQTIDEFLVAACDSAISLGVLVSCV